MKFKKNFLATIMSLTIVLPFITAATIPAIAHDAMLNVDYDNCQGNVNNDDIYEAWYVLEHDGQTSHISHETHTIKYYFEEKYPDTDITWVPEGESSAVGEEIKMAYASSMEKWNNIYFYSYNQDGTVTKNKLINVVEGTASDHNLTVYPVTGLDGTIAMTGALVSGEELIIETGTTTHAHYSDWGMFVNIDYFYPHDQLTSDIVNFIKDRNGAHELGHVLGLLDVDYDHICGSTLDEDHHYELLMGYGADMLTRSSNITYKDIAGVAITRGFHTDSDHKWLNCGLQSNGNYKLICSICNGVKNVTSLSGYIYQTYEACGGNHSLSSGNMLAVASYGNKDYYKCEYCRYVAPFSSIVTQSYIITYYGNNLDKYTNTVSGLEYTFYQEHIHLYTNRYELYSQGQHKAYCECGEYVLKNHVIQLNECIACGEPHTTHNYSDHHIPKTNSTHISYCVCGASSIQPHVVSSGAFSEGNKYAICLACGGTATTGTVIHQGIDALPRSENGSFILPNSVIVLVDEDIDAYFDGTLEFVYPDGNLETE